ncbi:hypothetical protein H072_3646 [Dactylellina haptotyla CBS 200.50]|uniref:NADP-dependent oxidoreductase domain-containing protein n=1 Tax=Dactylellina haptotyla (strain CBS 200.50) TaxID=1284197 RepID=S8BSI7_DACHA|nr:hypothetical protein H072_3646 [Dactylellina haptotyla CBS 200.50]
MAQQAPVTNIKIVLGAMTIGVEGMKQTCVFGTEVAGEFLDTFQKHGHNEIDTARVYGEGTSEQVLGKLDLEKRGLIVSTKLSKTSKIGLPDGMLTTHRPEHLRQGLEVSLKALNLDKVDMFYLHAPDRTTPYEDTLRELNKMHQEGKFNRIGISNYMAWEVAQICEICNRNGWVKPSVYQGIYNAFHRGAEAELFPCLRKYGISFYEYNPLAGGYLTDRYQRGQTYFEPGTRFDPQNKKQSDAYNYRYWKDEYFDALDILRAAVKKHGISEAEAALRWCMHHSALKREHGDAVIIGASSSKQLEENLVNFEKGPLPDKVVEVFEQGWKTVKAVCVPYFR